MVGQNNIIKSHVDCIVVIAESLSGVYWHKNRPRKTDRKYKEAQLGHLAVFGLIGQKQELPEMMSSVDGTC